MMPQTAQVAANPGHVPCAADSACRFPGRMLLEGMSLRDRICIFHFYKAMERGEKEAEQRRAA
jgi:hypothetical protein